MSLDDLFGKKKKQISIFPNIFEKEDSDELGLVSPLGKRTKRFTFELPKIELPKSELYSVYKQKEVLTDILQSPFKIIRSKDTSAIDLLKPQLFTETEIKIKTSFEIFRENKEKQKEKEKEEEDEKCKEIEKKHSMKEIQIGLELKEYLNTEFGPRGTELSISLQNQERLGLFREATRKKVKAQYEKENGEQNLFFDDCINSIEKYSHLISLCEKEDENKSSERLRRIFLIDAYESIADILMLPGGHNEGTYQNAINCYTQLKQIIKEFIEWNRRTNLDIPDLEEAKVILFSTHMALAGLYLNYRQLDASCNETLDALEIMKSRNNPSGVDYGGYIPSRLREKSYATKRFCDAPRNNHEIPKAFGFLGRLLTCPSDFTHTEKKKQIFLKEIENRRRIANKASILCFEHVSNFNQDEEKQAHFVTREQNLQRILEDIALEPTNIIGYSGLSHLIRSNNREEQEIGYKAGEIMEKMILQKAVTGNFDLVPVHPNYSDILTDGLIVIKKEESAYSAKKHIALLEFLNDKCKHKLPNGKVLVTNKGQYYVQLGLIRNKDNGKPDQEFRACSLEDMDSLYKSEVDWINTPTIAELTEFRKKKLKQVIDVMIEFSSAGKEKESFAKYGLDIPNYDYQKVLEEKVFKKLSLDEQLKEQAEKVVAELMKQERIFSHCDLHSGNILVKGDGDIAIIDPLSASYANRFFDIAYLLEQAEIGLNKDEKSDIINYFIEKLESNREHLEKPQRTYDLNAALINLREAAIHGNKNSKHYNESLSQTHLKRANQLLEELFPNMPLQA